MLNLNGYIAILETIKFCTNKWLVVNKIIRIKSKYTKLFDCMQKKRKEKK